MNNRLSIGMAQAGLGSIPPLAKIALHGRWVGRLPAEYGPTDLSAAHKGLGRAAIGADAAGSALVLGSRLAVGTDIPMTMTMPTRPIIMEMATIVRAMPETMTLRTVSNATVHTTPPRELILDMTACVIRAHNGAAQSAFL